MQKLIHKEFIAIIILFLLETIACGVLFFLVDGNYITEYIVDILIGSLFVVILLDLMIMMFSLNRISNAKFKTDISSLKVVGHDLQAAYDFGKIGLIITDENNDVVWTNTFFSDIQSKLIDRNIFEWEPHLKELNDTSLDEMKIEINNRNYAVKYLSKARLYIFRDITTNEELIRYSVDHAPAVGIIVIDNYQDMVNILDDISVNDNLAAIQKVIVEYAKKFNLLLKKYKSDSYLFICTRADYRRLIDDRFSILQEVRNESNDNGNELTLSVGLSSGIDNYSRLFEMASTALDVALSRGGNRRLSRRMARIFVSSAVRQKRKKRKIRFSRESCRILLEH